MKLAIVGSRDFNDRELMVHAVTDWIRENGKPTHIVSGGAAGADKLAKELADDLGIKAIEHLPDYKRYPGKLAPLERNTLIVQDCDQMLAFPTENARGTWNAVNKAKKSGKIVKIISS